MILGNPNYSPQPYHLVLISWAVLAFSVLINTRGDLLLPRFEAAMLLLHVFGFFAVVIPLVTLGPHQKTADVFATFSNGGEWHTQGLSFMIGILGMLWTFSGSFRQTYVKHALISSCRRRQCYTCMLMSLAFRHDSATLTS